jgi:hypothetical protein
MSKARRLLTASAAALALSLSLFALLIHQFHFDPFSWSFYGFEADTPATVRQLRGLELYAKAASILFGLSVALGMAAIFSRRRSLP